MYGDKSESKDFQHVFYFFARSVLSGQRPVTHLQSTELQGESHPPGTLQGSQQQCPRGSIIGLVLVSGKAGRVHGSEAWFCIGHCQGTGYFVRIF